MADLDGLENYFNRGPLRRVNHQLAKMQPRQLFSLHFGIEDVSRRTHSKQSENMIENTINS